MDKRELLEALVQEAQDGPMIPVPLAWLRALLLGESETSEREKRIADLTVEDVASEFGKSPQTIRDWCRRGLLRGANKPTNREWRIPQAALTALVNANKSSDGEGERQASARSDLGAWRRHLSSVSPQEG